ncbi:MAG: hypothetical protein J1E85_06840 [Ruminococcus sp.]|nr:hypothetical protein [Ruminococcus sp.]
MLKVSFKDSDGNELKNSEILSIALNSEIDVPADSISVTLPYDADVALKAHLITASIEENVVFKGIVDEVVSLCDEKQAIMKLTARSPAGLLLDNEAEPVTYYCPSAEFICDKHLKPFGIEVQDADDIPISNYFRIDKGSTHWQVLENFCKLHYGTSPRIDGDGKAFLKGKVRDESFVFGKNGIDYVSIKESRKKCELISSVRVKIEEFGGYTSKVLNDNPECKTINRVRFMNATADTGGLKTADKIIENSNKKSYCIMLLCNGCVVDAMGCKATICDDRFGNIENLVVQKVQYSLGADGEFTALELGKEI